MGNACRRLSIVLAAALSLGMAQTTQTASAQAAFPDHPVHFIVGYAPGGSVDIVARLLGQKLQEKWKQPVVVENRPGADGSVAATYVAHAPPDGYTIILVTGNITVPPEGYTLQYDPVKSFTQITQVAYLRNDLVVNASLPVKTLSEFIAMVKAKPGQMNMGSPGTGTTNYLDMAQMMQLNGMNMQNITYKGGSDIIKALLGNEIDMIYAPIPISYELVKAGKLKALAVSGDGREPSMPDVPNFQDEIKFKPSVNWFGVLAPAGLPANVTTRLHDDLVEVLKMPETQAAFAQQGITAMGNSGEEFTKSMSNDLARWAEIVKTVQR